MAKAIGLISGGLDSAIAVKLIKDQGIEVLALHIETQFSSERVEHPELGMVPAPQALAFEMGIEYRSIRTGDEYFELIKRPPHGWGSNLNPCLDCHTHFFAIGAKIMREEGFDFVFTGEVMGQRPMSQTREYLRYVERASGLEGYLLRPLSAKVLPETIPEQRGIVDRDRLLGIKGRSRKEQMKLAKQWGLKYYSSPAGGCLLTDRNFSLRLEVLLDELHPNLPTPYDIELLKIGRHFQTKDGARYIVARNNSENSRIIEAAKGAGIYFANPRNFPAPVVALSMRKELSKEELEPISETMATFMMLYGKVEKASGEPVQIVISTPNQEEFSFDLPRAPLFDRQYALSLRVDGEGRKLRRTPWI